MIEQNKVSADLATARAGGGFRHIEWPRAGEDAKQSGFSQGRDQFLSQSKQVLHFFGGNCQTLRTWNSHRAGAENTDRTARDEDVGIAGLAAPVHHAANKTVIEDEQRAAIAAHRDLDARDGRDLLRPSPSGVNDNFTGDGVFLAGIGIAETNPGGLPVLDLD